MTGRYGFLRTLVAGALAAAQTTIPLKVAGPWTDDWKTILFAQRSGLFTKYGLAVEIAGNASGAATLAAVAGGSIQIAFSSLLPVITAHARGLNFQVVAPAGVYVSATPYALLLVKKDSPIRSGRDLNGKTVGTLSLKDTNATATLAWIDQNGGDAQSVRVIELPNAAILAALEDGRIDASTIGSPFVTQALDTGRVRALGKSYDAIAKRFSTAAWFGAPEAVAKAAYPMSQFARAMHESILSTNAHPEDTVEMVASFTGAEARSVARSVRAVDDEYADPRDMQPVIDAAVRYKIIEKRFEAAELISPVALRPFGGFV